LLMKLVRAYPQCMLMDILSHNQVNTKFCSYYIRYKWGNFLIYYIWKWINASMEIWFRFWSWGLYKAYADGGYKAIVSDSVSSSEGTIEIKSCTELFQPLLRFMLNVKVDPEMPIIGLLLGHMMLQKALQ